VPTKNQAGRFDPVKRFSSIMTQLLQLFSRNEFQQEVEATQAEWHARGFASWDHFVAMVFGQLADSQSLREIEGGLASCEGRLQQFGINVPSRSTLSYANRNRPSQLFQNVFYRLSQRCRADLGEDRKTRFRFKNPLLSIDSSVVTLALEMFPWAKWTRKKGAIKLHMTLDHAGYLPQALVITTGKYSEMAIARRAHYEPGTIVTMDRGFVDYRWFNRLNESGVFFVTRLKKDVPYEVVERRPALANKGVVADERIQLTGKGSRKRYPYVLRLITFDTKEGERFVFLTNQMVLAASTIADIYKDRWQIETFFKLLKQNLRVKTFLGTSANGVWTQIWAAMIAMLLIKFLQLKARYGWSFANLAYFLRMNLFVHRDLWEWLHDPFPDLSPPLPPQQLELWA
jgi:hypothetical protein